MFKFKLNRLRISSFRKLELRKRKASKLMKKLIPLLKKLRKSSPPSSRRRRLISRRKNLRLPLGLRLSLPRPLIWNQPLRKLPRLSLSLRFRLILSPLL
jgi:hypothetical protein